MNDYITIIYMKYKLKWIDNKYLKYLSNIDWLAIYEKWNTTAKIVWIENIIRRYWLWHGMAWHGMVWYGMVLYGIVWYGMVWYGMVWYGLVGIGCWVLVQFGRFLISDSFNITNSEATTWEWTSCCVHSRVVFVLKLIYTFSQKKTETRIKRMRRRRRESCCRCPYSMTRLCYIITCYNFSVITFQ